MCVTLSVAAVYYAIEGRGACIGIMGMFSWMQADADRFFAITVISFISEGTYGLSRKKSIGNDQEKSFMVCTGNINSSILYGFELCQIWKYFRVRT